MASVPLSVSEPGDSVNCCYQCPEVTGQSGCFPVYRQEALFFSLTVNEHCLSTVKVPVFGVHAFLLWLFKHLLFCSVMGGLHVPVALHETELSRTCKINLDLCTGGSTALVT